MLSSPRGVGSKEGFKNQFRRKRKLVYRQDIHVNPRKENLNIPDWISNLKYRAIFWATCKPCKSIIARHCGRVVHPGRAGSVTNGRLIATPLFVYNNNGMVNQTLFAYLGYFGGRGIYD